jgi:hypothetical protein
MKKLRNIKEVRVFVWNTFNWLITLISTLALAQTEPTLVALAPVIMAWLTMITKYVNKKYFNDLWVTN